MKPSFTQPDLKFPKRDEHTNWWNNEPITDLQEALYFLNQESSSIEPHHLARNQKTQAFELVWEWARDGSSGGASSGSHYFQIGPELAQRLVDEKLVEPYAVKDWGHTWHDKNRLVISAKGLAQSKAFNEEMRTKAQSLLVPGKHTDLTGEVGHGALQREQRMYGKLYVDFHAPNDEICRVYPETGSIEF